MSPSNPTLGPKRRLYGEDGNTNLATMASLRDPLHRLFSRWINTHHQERDFVVAMDHSATSMYVEYVLAGAPRFEGESLPAPLLLALPDQLMHAEGPRLRFYDDNGTLSVSNETLQEHRTVLAPLFLAWTMRNHFERDFIVAVRDTAVALCYDYTVCRSLGGDLGGGLTAEEFITRPVRPC